jgi:hypothetical protein
LIKIEIYQEKWKEKISSISLGNHQFSGKILEEEITKRKFIIGRESHLKTRNDSV